MGFKHGEREIATEPDRVFRVVRIRFLLDHTYDNTLPLPPLPSRPQTHVDQLGKSCRGHISFLELHARNFSASKKKDKTTVLGFVLHSCHVYSDLLFDQNLKSHIKLKKRQNYFVMESNTINEDLSASPR